MTIVLEPVDMNNLELAVDTAVAIFSERDREGIELEFRAAAGYEDDIRDAENDLRIVNPHYFLAKRDGVPVGVTGYYYIKDHEEDVWLGWMGVLEQFHRQGIGKVLVQEAFSKAAEFDNPTNLRIWTTREPAYEDARKQYTKMSFIEEPYKPEATDAAALVSIFSKSVDPNADAGYEWQYSAYYPIDCDKYVVPELNERLGLGGYQQNASTARHLALQSAHWRPPALEG